MKLKATPNKDYGIGVEGQQPMGNLGKNECKDSHAFT